MPLREWTKRERLEAERESLGLYLTGHPFEDFAEHCKKFARESIAKVIASMPHDGAPFHVRKEVILAGVVMDVRKRGPRVSIVLDDDTERIEVTMFEDVYAQCKHLITKHAVLIAEGQLRYDDFINGWRQTARACVRRTKRSRSTRAASRFAGPRPATPRRSCVTCSARCSRFAAASARCASSTRPGPARRT